MISKKDKECKEHREEIRQNKAKFKKNSDPLAFSLNRHPQELAMHVKFPIPDERGGI